MCGTVLPGERLFPHTQAWHMFVAFEALLTVIANGMVGVPPCDTDWVTWAAFHSARRLRQRS